MNQQQVTKTAKNLSTEALEKFGDLTERLEDGGKEMLVKIQDGSEEVVSWVRANPLKSVAIALGASFLIARMFFGARAPAEKKYLN
jgi:ElaB/YqjD/DUF883 family membrane-anchored ribosome-binding protein